MILRIWYFCIWRSDKDHSIMLIRNTLRVLNIQRPVRPLKIGYNCYDLYWNQSSEIHGCSLHVAATLTCIQLSVWGGHLPQVNKGDNYQCQYRTLSVSVPGTAGHELHAQGRNIALLWMGVIFRLTANILRVNDCLFVFMNKFNVEKYDIIKTFSNE